MWFARTLRNSIQLSDFHSWVHKKRCIQNQAMQWSNTFELHKHKCSYRIQFSKSSYAFKKLPKKQSPDQITRKSGYSWFHPLLPLSTKGLLMFLNHATSLLVLTMWFTHDPTINSSTMLQRKDKFVFGLGFFAWSWHKYTYN